MFISDIVMKKILAMVTCFSALSCYYNKEDELYPNTGSCDTTNVTYSSTINSILINYNCAFCHSSAANSGNIILTNYISLKTVADNGKLLGSITHTPGFSPMPRGAPKMKDCDINKIKTWIDAGAPDN